jgi:hypothetical protein
VPLCRCVSSGTNLCTVPWLATDPKSFDFKCPTNQDYRSIPGATTGGACSGFEGGGLPGHPSNPKRSGAYECRFQAETRTYGPADRAPCSGFSTDDGQPYNGVTDCH